MTIEIKQSTAVTFLLGPFVDKTDGVTPETGLATAMDNATTGIRLSKNGGNMADRSDATAPVHDEDGFYTIVLNTTDTNTLGHLQVEYTEVATCLPAWIDFLVVTANYWDTKYSTDQFDVNVTNMADNVLTAAAINADAITAAKIAPAAMVKGDQVTGFNDIASPVTVGTMNANVLNAAAIAATALNGKGDWNIGKTGYSLAATGLDAIVAAATGMVEIAKAVWDRVLTGAFHNITNSGGKRLRLLQDAGVVTSGTAQAGGVASITLASGESATTGIFDGDRIVIVGGTGVGEHGIITTYDGPSKVATMSQNWVIQPDVTSEYELVPADVDVETWQHVVVTKSTTTNLPEVDIASISDDTAAADNLELDYDGTGLDRANSTIGVLAATQASIDAIEADTNELQADDVPTLIAAVQSDTDDIQTRIPAALISGRMNSDIEAINDNTASAVNLRLTTSTIFNGAVEDPPAASVTVFQTDLAEAQNDIYIGRVVIFTSGAALGEATDITDYAGASGTITVTALANAPANGDTFIIV